MVGVNSAMYVPLILESLKWKKSGPAELEISENPSTPSVTLPDFQPEWEDEFIEADYQPRPFNATCCVAAIFFTVSFFLGYFGSGGYRTAGGGQMWIAATWGPHLLCALISALLMWQTCLRNANRFLMRNYNAICFCLTTFYYANLVWYNLMREVRRARFQYHGAPHITWGSDYSGPLPVRLCNDSDPATTWRDWSVVGSAVGCNNLILSGNIFAFYALVSLLPAILRMRPLPALAAAAAKALVLVAAVLAVGSRPWLLVSALAFQLAAGLSSTYMCRVRRRLAREQFAIAKGTRGAAKQNRTLLHTLIPKNVLGRLSTHAADAGMLGTTIPECTVMFCSLEPQARAPPRPSAPHPLLIAAEPWFL
jgi:hypothetical protein